MATDPAQIEYQFPARMQLNDAFLAKLAGILGAEYRDGDFAAAFERFRASDSNESVDWFLRGPHGNFRVLLQLGGSHLRCLLRARAPQVYAAKELMLREPATRQDHRQYLVPGDTVLVPMAALLQASYGAGDFDRAWDDFHEGDDDERAWTMEGACGRFTVWLEKGETYCSCLLSAQEPQLSACIALMKRS